MSVYSIPPSLDPERLFPFALDNFQMQAIAALEANKSAVVCVPTGSGKTLVGEYAIYRALARQKRVFYTTPLKALSNQKLRDFKERFGAERVGLLTGDTSINRGADVVVMTTEIFRNMLYGTPIGQVGISLEDVEVVVLDECHYMNDPSRGTVWEEAIIYCPPEIQLLALSATIANAGQLTDWINQVHGPTELIKSDFRPVPLEFYFSTKKGLFPLLNPGQTKLNPRLKPQKRGGKQRVRREDCPNLRMVVEQLQQREMLPAIYFIFSRRGCDEAVGQLNDLTLVNEAEAAEIKQRLRDFLHQYPDGARSGQEEPLTRGIAAHHAGILPLWKGLVEDLFGRGLVKVVFATETLAAGINMPARTTVISAISKRTDRGHRLLRASEFLQMAGRAGRRGMDEMGHVVCVQTRFEGAKEAAFIATKEADPLVSQFTPTYGMVLNLLQTHTIQEAKRLLERSFAQYLASLKLLPTQKAIADLTAELTRLDIELAPIQGQHFASYEKLYARLREERRILRYLQRQANETRSEAIAAQLDPIIPGTIVYLRGKHVGVPTPVVAAYATEIPTPQARYYLCLAQENRWYVVTQNDIAGVSEMAVPEPLVSALIPPDNIPLRAGKRVTSKGDTAAIATWIDTEAPPFIEAPEVAAQQAKIEALEQQLEEHPLQQWGDPATLIQHQQLRQDLREEVQQHQAQSRLHQSQHWQEFLNIVEVLQTFEALDGYTPTALGQAAAALRGDNELWLALALTSGGFNRLEPDELAAACCALVSEPPRPDSWTNLVPPSATLEALDELRDTRRQLFQVQHRHRVAIPVWQEDLLIGLVAQWAGGETSWNDLCDSTSLDEGDIVRMLRRTMDFLSQIPHVPNLSQELQRNAIDAIRGMERFPVEE